jgi:uncharacterized protein YndB with AHSA1/START domain
MGDAVVSEDALVIERTFDAPVEVVWRMWTDPDAFKAWYGPEGATIPHAELDVRVGGIRRVCMAVQTPGGPMRMWFAGEHREVVPMKRLVYTESMTDEDGNAMTPPGSGDDHPSATEVRVELQSLGERTSMVLTHIGIPADSPGATGWSMALDKLTATIGRRSHG